MLSFMSRAVFCGFVCHGALALLRPLVFFGKCDRLHISIASLFVSVILVLILFRKQRNVAPVEQHLHLWHSFFWRQLLENAFFLLLMLKGSSCLTCFPAWSGSCFSESRISAKMEVQLCKHWTRSLSCSERTSMRSSISTSHCLKMLRCVPQSHHSNCIPPCEWLGGSLQKEHLQQHVGFWLQKEQISLL